MTSALDFLVALTLWCGLLALLGYGARYGGRLLRRMHNKLDFLRAESRWFNKVS